MFQKYLLGQLIICVFIYRYCPLHFVWLGSFLQCSVLLKVQATINSTLICFEFFYFYILTIFEFLHHFNLLISVVRSLSDFLSITSLNNPSPFTHESTQPNSFFFLWSCLAFLSFLWLCWTSSELFFFFYIVILERFLYPHFTVTVPPRYRPKPL